MNQLIIRGLSTRYNLPSSKQQSTDNDDKIGILNHSEDDQHHRSKPKKK